MQDKLTLDPLPLVIPEKQIPRQNFHFLLGASDAEMTRIREILTAEGLSHSQALYEGLPVHVGNAYIADPISLPPGTFLIFVECGLRSVEGCEEVAGTRSIDHHNVGDAGYPLGAEWYWEASSLGQLYRLLRLGAPPKTDRIIAARDHCLFDAWKGKCPGVTPEDVTLYSSQAIAAEKGTTILTVESTIWSMAREVKRAPIVTIGGQDVTDVRHLAAGVGYSLEYLSIKEALALTGQAGLIKTKNVEDGPDKVMMCGAVPLAIEDFTTSWGPAQGLQKFFYVPARGYAGGFHSR